MNEKKSLIIYFSRADENYFGGELKYINKGNTEVVAEYIKELTNSDMFKVEPLVLYSKDYMTCIEEAKNRTKTHNAPIKEKINDISNYDVIYIGTPIYWGGMPEEMFTALKDLNFSGKKIKPFVTHEGSGLSSVPRQLKSICLDAEILDGIAITGSRVYSSKDEIEKWIKY